MSHRIKKGEHASGGINPQIVPAGGEEELGKGYLRTARRGKNDGKERD